MQMKLRKKVKLYNIKERPDGNWKLCPLCDSELDSCHIGVFCSSKKCRYVDGIAFLTKGECKKFKDKIE